MRCNLSAAIISNGLLKPLTNKEKISRCAQRRPLRSDSLKTPPVHVSRHDPQHVLQQAKRMRLCDKTQRPHLIRDPPVLDIGRSRIYDHRDMPQSLFTLELREKLPAIHHRHIDIEKNNIRCGEFAVAEPVKSIGAARRMMTNYNRIHSRKRFGEELPIVGIVVDQ